MRKKLLAAIEKDARAKNRTLIKKADQIFRDIYDQFNDMVDVKTDDPDEEEVRSKICDFLAGAEFTFEDVKADLARIKRRYD
jgi:hypothetical protein